jgi:hypothetical protein
MKVVDVPKRTCFHTIRLTSAEADELTAHADRARVSISELLRRRALDRPLPRAAAPSIIVEKYGELARLAANLNHAMKHANQLGVLDRPQFVTLVSDCLAQVQNLRKDLIGANK